MVGVEAEHMDDGERQYRPAQFFECVTDIEPYFRFHDDLWISTFLKLRNLTMLHVPVNWTRLTMDRHVWTKSRNARRLPAKTSSLLYINQNVSLPARDGSENSILRLTHTRVNAHTSKAYARMRDGCAGQSGSAGHVCGALAIRAGTPTHRPGGLHTEHNQLVFSAQHGRRG